MSSQIGVLLVDDHALLRKGLAALLGAESGIRVVGEAGGGEEAIAQVRALQPDVVIMDISMPGLGGIDATRQIRADSPDSKVIALSIHSSKRFVDDMLDAGAAGYLLKESAPEELVQAIHAMMRGEMYLSSAITATVVSAYLDGVAAEGATTDPGAAAGILRTKLHRPPAPQDLVPRTRLLENLESGRVRPLTLVSAPAGYGKSMLISNWLENADWPSAWLSLDEADSEIRQFLGYFVAAVKSIFADACEQSEGLSNTTSLPPVGVVAATLANELDALEQPFLLVLDDYHLIHASSPVNDLLGQLLARPPLPLHLVIVCRRDPALHLVNLRARGQLNELRMQDLRFSREDTRSMLRQHVKQGLSDKAIERLEQELEGWAVGLRLVTLAMSRVEDPETLLRQLSAGFTQAQDYLVHEVINNQPAALRDWLLKSAILDRFCTPLCDAICAQDNGTASSELVGGRFIELLRESNLFVIPLDAQGKWFRHHHLFQHLLQNQLERHITPKAITQLHARASEWFESKALIDEALSHALAAGDSERAAQIVERNRQHVLDTDRWYDLEKWLARLPEALVQQRVGLMMAQVWILFLRFRFEGVTPILENVESILGDNSDERALRGEISLMRGYILFFLGEGTSSLQHIEDALQRVPVSFGEARAQSEIIFALSSQMVGRKKRALDSLSESLESYQSPNELRKTRLLVSYVFVHLISADLPAAGIANQRLKMVVDRNRYAYAEAWNDYLQGIIHLCRYELDAAVEFLGRSVSNRFVHHQRAALDSFAGLILAYQALGRSDDAEATSRLLREYVSSLDDPQFWVLVESVEVRFAILQGWAAPTLRWLEASAPPEEKAMLWWLEIPCISRCRALVSEGSSANLDDAQQRLREYVESTEARHNKLHLIGILALQAVAYNKQHKLEDALAVLARALTLAEKNDFMFPFLELGQPMIELLEHLADKKGFTDFVNRLIDRYQSVKKQHPIAAASRSESSRGLTTDPLTKRERDILKLLAQRLQNKEIAAKLFVSPETVKSHVKNLYQKLKVSNRRDAAVRATKILTSIEASPADDGADRGP